MKFIKKQILCWEPLEIRFVPQKKKKGWEEEVFSWLLGWEKERMKIAGDMESSQLPLECYVAEVKPDGTVIVHIEWLCEKAIDVFAKYIRKKGSNVKQLVIGDELDDVLPTNRIGLEIQFIKIPEKIIYTETKTDIKVPSFEISKYSITVGQYRRFAEETGYKTTNEQAEYYLTYYANDLLIALSKKKRETASATCLSYNDAIEYCKWAKVRLPSDHEWLSAAVLDWKKEYKYSEISEEMVQKYALKSAALHGSAHEWTSEYIARSDRAYVREGPGYLLEKGWKRRRERKKYPADHTDLLLGFRVCKVK